MNRKFMAWAIDTKESGFIGRYWWFENPQKLLPPHLEGCEIALFLTRKHARIGLLTVKKGFHNARVVPVSVKISSNL